MESLVSIITPLYNSIEFIPRLISSVRGQDYQNYEHIVVDDCSTDGGLDLVRSLSQSDPRLRIIALKKNSGVVAARNAGLECASGEFITFLDADDYWLPHKLSLQLSFMLKNNCAISFTDYRSVTEDGLKEGRLLRGPNKITWRVHHMTRYLGCLTVMLNRHKVVNFKFEILPREFTCEDFYAWSEVIRLYGPALRCPYDLGRYTIVANSRSRNGVNASKHVWRLYRDVERIPFFLAAFYFISYIFFSTYKRYVYRPR